MKVDGVEFYSVSQLELWASCKRAWYLIKRCGYKEPGLDDNPYLVRGRLVHEILEDDAPDMRKAVLEHKDFTKLNRQFQNETKHIFKMIHHHNELPSKPIHKELEIINKDLKMVAYVDVIGKDYIVDYKTSRFWKTVPENYWWQVKIYALLYYLKTGIFIRHLGIYYVKYGRIEWITIEEEDLVVIEKVLRDTIKSIEESERMGDFDECTYTGPWDCPCGKVLPPGQYEKAKPKKVQRTPIEKVRTKGKTKTWTT